ncbi:MAG: radical SAM protein, partial [Acidobacteriota bacterium]|nr:radical SAM protein [Acidobacteriota bacterium]
MANQEPATSVGKEAKTTEVGSVFVSNYPPYSFWSAEADTTIQDVLDRAPAPDAQLGLYIHIPFCRKRCKFCYFRVFTDKNASEIERYLSAVEREAAMLADQPAVQGRRPKLVYFGGGTPSFISSKHLRQLTEGLRRRFDWSEVEEFAFECEPGTLTQQKLETIRDVGVTRLSLGVENFDDRILEENGRAHVTKEIYKVLPWIRALDFPQLNIDLIAGMVGETWETWRVSVAKAIEMSPDSVTVYQMELPYNTVYSKTILQGAPR